MGDEYVDGPLHDEKREKQLKIITIWKNYGGITILNHNLCDLHKLGWVFFCFSFPYIHFTIHIFLTLKAGAHNPEGTTSIRSCHGDFYKPVYF